jgi:hypothetical protein
MTKDPKKKKRKRDPNDIPESAKLLRELYERGMKDLAEREARGERVRP